MRLVRILGVASLSVVFLPSVARQAHAEVLFSENFEIPVASGGTGGNDTENASVATAGPLVPDIGRYSDPNTNTRVAAYGATGLSNPVVAAAVPAAPNLDAGSHTARLQGWNPATSAGSGGRLAAFLTKPASVPGSAFRLEFDVYASGTVGFGFGSQNRAPFEGGGNFGLAQPGSSRPRQSFGVNMGSGVVNLSRDTDNNPATANASTAPTGLTYTVNTWTHMIIDYIIGAGTVTLTVGSQTPVVIQNGGSTAYPVFLSATDSDFDSANGLTPLQAANPTQVDAIFFSTGTAGSIGFIDNVVATGVAFDGDANHDLKVNTLDFNALANYFGATANASWQEGDFNADNKIDSVDFDLLVANFGAVYTPPTAPALGSVVPEPASLGLLAVAALFAARRSRTK